MYNKLISDENLINKQRIRWQVWLNESIEKQEFLNAFDAICVVTISTKLRDFQYRLLHNLIVTNHNLKVWGNREDDLCSFCESAKEHTLHLFIRCPEVAKVWDVLHSWMLARIGNQEMTQLDWSEKSIMLNQVHCSFGHVVNAIVLIAKQYFYRTRCLSAMPVFEALYKEILSVKKMEYMLARDSGKLTLYYKKWSKLFPELKQSQIETQTQNAYIVNYINQL